MGPFTWPKVPEGGHQALPVADSCYSEKTQLPANLQNEVSYPVIAVCSACHGRIRLAQMVQMEWVHVPASETQKESK